MGSNRQQFLLGPSQTQYFHFWFHNMKQLNCMQSGTVAPWNINLFLLCYNWHTSLTSASDSIYHSMLHYSRSKHFSIFYLIASKCNNTVDYVWFHWVPSFFFYLYWMMCNATTYFYYAGYGNEPHLPKWCYMHSWLYVFLIFCNLLLCNYPGNFNSGDKC